MSVDGIPFLLANPPIVFLSCACVRHGLHISCACENSDWWCMPFVNVETKEEVTCGHAWFSLIGFLKESRMGISPESCWIPVGFWPCASRIPGREICMFPSYTNFLSLSFSPPQFLCYSCFGWSAHGVRIACACFAHAEKVIRAKQ